MNLRRKDIMDKPVKSEKNDFEKEEKGKKREETVRREKIFELVGPFV